MMLKCIKAKTYLFRPGC